MRQAGWGEVNESLDLMNHGICVGHVAHFLHDRASVSSNHMINLFLDFSYLVTVRRVGKGEK